MTPIPQRARRKIVLISPLFQGGTALAFAVLVFLGGAYFAWHIDGDIGQALRDASFAGHYRFRSAYDIVGELLVAHLAVLFAGGLLGAIALLFLVIRKVRVATARIAESFRISGEGDLSTPTVDPGPGEFAVFGNQVDAARTRTLELADGIRAEVDFMRREPLSDDEFQRRWEGLRERIGRFVP